ncbi:MAG: bifunctional DNA primase/polymerase, partial [Bacillota bacterium]
MMKVKAAARFYRKTGLSITPLRPGKKTPKIKWTQFQKRIMPLEEIEEYFGKNSNIAIVTGKISNIIVLDIDPRNGGDDTIKDLPIPDTVTAETGGGGLHFYFKYPEGFDKISPFNDTKEYPGVDLKADGGYIVGEPSLHPSGERYKFVEGKCFGEIELAEAPEWLIKFIRKRQSGNGKKNKSNSPKKANTNYNSIKTDNIFDAVDRMVDTMDAWDRYGDGQEPINNKICCPFHDDSNPSLSFNVEENYYNCFGCQAGGGPVDLVMRLLKLSSAIEAVNILEEDFNLDLDKYRLDKNNNRITSTDKEIYELVLEHSLKLIKDDHFDFLNDKYSLSRDIAKKYKIGFIDYNDLKDKLDEYSQQELM